MKTKEERELEIQKISKELQDDCQSMIKEVKNLSDKDLSYQDITNAWLYYKLAEIKYNQQETNDKYNKIKEELEEIKNNFIN